MHTKIMMLGSVKLSLLSKQGLLKLLFLEHIYRIYMHNNREK